MARLKEEYNSKIKAELMKEGGYANTHEVPNFVKISVNSGVGEATTNKHAVEEVVEILEQITGQKPVINKARLSVSSFKLREGMEVGVSVTLRGDRMWEFLDKMVNVVFPRTKDFRGVSAKSFDGSGNYSLGFDDHTVFPEIDTSKVSKLRHLQVTIVTSSRDDAGAKMLLDKFGFPFKQDGKKE